MLPCDCYTVDSPLFVGYNLFVRKFAPSVLPSTNRVFRSEDEKISSGHVLPLNLLIWGERHALDLQSFGADVPSKVVGIVRWDPARILRTLL